MYREQAPFFSEMGLSFFIEFLMSFYYEFGQTKEKSSRGMMN